MLTRVHLQNALQELSFQLGANWSQCTEVQNAVMC
jgi:hypothetical protein